MGAIKSAISHRLPFTYREAAQVSCLQEVLQVQTTIPSASKDAQRPTQLG